MSYQVLASQQVKWCTNHNDWDKAGKKLFQFKCHIHWKYSVISQREWSLLDLSPAPVFLIWGVCDQFLLCLCSWNSVHLELPKLFFNEIQHISHAAAQRHQFYVSYEVVSTQGTWCTEDLKDPFLTSARPEFSCRSYTNSKREEHITLSMSICRWQLSVEACWCVRPGCYERTIQCFFGIVLLSQRGILFQMVDLNVLGCNNLWPGRIISRVYSLSSSHQRCFHTFSSYGLINNFFFIAEMGDFHCEELFLSTVPAAPLTPATAKAIVSYCNEDYSGDLYAVLGWHVETRQIKATSTRGHFSG